ncbi:hypothetical protein Tco_1402949 [Tanacetum coccineum]
MEISIADQIALDDALVASADRLKIGKCNLRLSSDVSSKEATLQVVYDVLKLTPFYKAFQVTADAPEIYMQEFWASAYVHNRSVRFKMNNNFNTDIANHTSSKKDQIDNLLKERRLMRSLETMEILLLLQPLESYKEYYAMASGTIPPKTKGSKKKANTDAIPKLKLSTAPKKQKLGAGKQKTSELENISEADLTEAEQLKIMKELVYTRGSPDALNFYDSDDDISWKSSDDDQDDEQDQDDDDAEKHEDHETTLEEEDDDEHDDDENDQEDDDASDDDKKV